MEEHEGDDLRDVEQDGSGCRDPELVQRIENSAEQRCQRDQHQIGEGQPGQHHREGELLRRRAVEAERDEVGRGPGEDLEQHRHQQQRGQQHREGVLGEVHAVAEAGAVLVRDLAVEHRDERRGEGSLGEQGAEHVGHSPGDGEGIGGEIGADELGEQHVAGKAKNPADQGQSADRSERTGEIHRLRCARCRGRSGSGAALFGVTPALVAPRRPGRPAAPASARRRLRRSRSGRAGAAESRCS